MSYLLKNALRTSVRFTVSLNTLVPSLEGIVRRAATFHDKTLIVFCLFSVGVAGKDFLLNGGDMGLLVDMAHHSELNYSIHINLAELRLGGQITIDLDGSQFEMELAEEESQ